MAQYKYRARNQEGKEVKGVLQAQNEQRASSLLRSNNLTPLTIELAEQSSILNLTVFGGSVDTRDRVLFSRQLSAMIRAGVPILESIKALSRQVDKPAFQRLLNGIAYDIESGESLSQALSKQPDTFDLFFIGVVRTGEASGQLADSLNTLADYLEQNYIFARKIRSALMYPIFVISAVIIVVILMLSFVVPQLVELFDEASVQLPLITRILIAVTDFLRDFWYVLILIAIALGILLRSYLKTPEGQYTVSSLSLHIPGVSPLFRKVYLSRMTSILHTLFKSDVPVIESLGIATSSIGNRVYQRILTETAEAVKDGAAISSVWEHEPFIPPMLTTMVAVGERSGNIQKSFQEAHNFFRRDVEEILESITVFLEPALVIVLGIGVGFIVAAVLLPIYNLVLVL